LTARRLFNIPEEMQEGVSIGFLAQVEKSYLCLPAEQWSSWPEVNTLESPLYLIQPQTDTSQPLWLEIQTLDLPWLSKKQRLLRIKDVTQTMALTVETWSFQSAARHKLLTPLANILLSTEVIRRFHNDGLSTDVLECVDTIDHSARRLDNEIKDILEYIYAPLITRPDAQFTLMDLEPLVQQITTDLSLKPVIYSIWNPEMQNAVIALSSRAIRVILWELLENAKKFHPTLDPHVEIHLSTPDQMTACLEIIDDGICLPPEQLAHVFIPYYQGEKIFTGEVSGMGLGLSTVAALIWQSGGQVQIQNCQEHTGVKVTLSLPIKEHVPA
jgi:two-component system, cell cycle response regulator